MVEIVVDQKPMDKLPYDPNDIPKAVRDRAAAVDALYQSSDGQPSEVSEQPQQSPAEPSTAQVPTQEVSSPTQTPAAPATPPSPDELDENSNTWKSRALSKEGRERKEVEELRRDLGELQERYYNEVAQQQQQPERRTSPKIPPAQKYLTPEDEQNYGRDLIDVAQRAALQTVAPHLQSLEQKNEALRRQLAKEQRRSMDQAVEMLVPDYREIDRNPRWHRWLLGIDVLSGRVRQTLLNEAISAGNAPRAASFFKSFVADEVATGHVESVSASSSASPPREPTIPLATLAAPGRARPATGGDASLPTDKPIYTRAQIKQLYEQHRRGAYVGREAEWARLEADFFTAQREGRYR
jgi:hypothetical protein